MAKPPTSIAATSTLAMVRTATMRGVEVTDLLQQAGLTRQSIEDPDARIPGPVVLRLWDALRERAADPALQLAAPASLPFGAYRVIDYLVTASATVGAGVERFARFFSLIADDLALTVVSTRVERCLCVAMADGGPVPPVYVDYLFAALLGRIRMRIRPGLALRRVDLRQPAPRRSAPHLELFGAPVQFGAPVDRLCFDIAEWDAPSASGDEALATLLEEHARILAEQLPHAASGFTEAVQKAIASLLPDDASADEVARKLNVSVRTLQRRLVASGSTFRKVIDAVRAKLAEGYLADPAVSMSEVAFLLGFSEQSAFNRAFRRWTGESPGRWRGRAASLGRR